MAWTESAMAWLILLLIAAFFSYRHFTRATWKDLPTLRQYLDAFPRCQTSKGICCRICNSGSIRNWGWKSSDDARRMFICNHCGQILYRNDLDN